MDYDPIEKYCPESIKLLQKDIRRTGPYMMLCTVEKAFRNEGLESMANGIKNIIDDIDQAMKNQTY